LSEELSHGEIQELLGAYALGAVDERERAIIEAHLETCETCRIELDDHSRLAENLRLHASRVSPLASVESNGSAKANGARPRADQGARWRFPVAMAVVLVLLGGLFARGEIRMNDLEGAMGRVELLERAHVATATPGAVVTTLLTPRNEPVLTVVSRATGGGSYAINSALPPLATGQTYQLWVIGTGGVTPAAALGRRPDTAVFSLPSGITGFVLTVEAVPAPDRPTLPAVATGRTTP
jgi:hypothetical protein